MCAMTHQHHMNASSPADRQQLASTHQALPTSSKAQQAVTMPETNTVHDNRLLGLTQQEAQQRWAQNGHNEIALARHRPLWRRVLDLLKEPMLALLVAAALIYIILGDLDESLILGSLVLGVMGLTLYQEGKSQASVEALRKLSQHYASVKRDGVVQKIPSREIVPGDCLYLAEGDRVAADGELLASEHLQIDESLLTGESLAVEKSVSNQVFSGSFVVQGQGIVYATQTGPHTEIGKIGGSLNQIENLLTPLQKQTQKLVKVLASIALVLCLFMVLFMGLQNGNWLAAVLAGIALGMAILPEEYPVVLAIFPAMGAHRLAKQGVITRKMTAIETLGAITVLCTDKTGTLTENKMKVSCLAVATTTVLPTASATQADVKDSASTFASDALSVEILNLNDIQANNASDRSGSGSGSGSATSPNYLLPEAFHELAEHAILASAAQAFDPMEVAFHELGQQYLNQTEHLHRQWELVKTYPLSSALRAMSHVWKHNHQNGGYTISAKGAPEAVMSLCHFSPEQIQHWSAVVNKMANQGLRVLAVAKGFYPSTEWPTQEHDFDFEWVGLMGLSDPIRPEIATAMKDCQTAGIKVLMITGDYPATAKVIAQQAGMPPGDVLSGDELESLSDEQLLSQLKTSNVCARISPHQKLRIVQVLKNNGEVVAMTGDGVNDAPALKAAHVGVAMGARGTDVAREASSLVLVDDNFASIVKGIQLGRRIFKNLQKSMTYIFAIHIPIAVIALLPMLLGIPPILLPLHIALLELIIDPACSLAFENEPEDAAIMQTPPRHPELAILDRYQLVYAFLQGVMAVLGVGLAYWLARSNDLMQLLTHQVATPEHIRTMVLVALITTHSLLIWVNRSQGRALFLTGPQASKNYLALWVTAGAWLMVLAGIYLPFLASVLELSSLSVSQLALAIVCGGTSSIGLLVLRWLKKS